MSSSAASGYGDAKGASDLIKLYAWCLNGEGCTLKLSHSTLGRDVLRMVSRHLPVKESGKLVVNHKNSLPILQKALPNQSIVGKAATLSCTYIPTNVYEAWCPGRSHQDRRRNFSLVANTEQSSAKPWKLDIRQQFQPELTRSYPAKQSSEFDIWLLFQSVLGRSEASKQSAKLAELDIRN